MMFLENNKKVGWTLQEDRISTEERCGIRGMQDRRERERERKDVEKL